MKHKRFHGRAQRYVTQYKLAHPTCTDCRQDHAPHVLEFDHVRGTKRAAMNIVARTSSIPVTQEEIAKCELICANCHRHRTHWRACLHAATGVLYPNPPNTMPYPFFTRFWAALEMDELRRIAEEQSPL